MADYTRAVTEFRPSRTVVRVAGWAQWLLAASCAAAYGLYAYARLTVGGHEAVVSGSHDPKDLGSGLVTGVAHVLHALAMIATILGPFAGVPFAAATLGGLALGGRHRDGRHSDGQDSNGQDSNGQRRAWWALFAVAATIAVLLAGQTAMAADIRRWILD